MKDSIFVSNLIVTSRIGLTEKERSKSQKVVVDLELFIDLRAAGRSDDILKTIDYRKILEIVRKTSGEGEYNLLEHLAEKIARRLLELSSARRVDLELNKAKYGRSPIIGVRISRNRSDG